MSEQPMQRVHQPPPGLQEVVSRPLWIPGATPRDRAVLVAQAVTEAHSGAGKGMRRTRNGKRLVFQAPPRLAVDVLGLVHGIAVQVRCYDAETGTELPIDPDRTFSELPPSWEADPIPRLWDALFDQIEVAPNPAGWRP